MRKFYIKPIGVVKSAFKGDTGMPFRGVKARISIDAKYKKAMDGLGQCKYLWILCFLHNADRRVLKAVPKKWKRQGILKERGVFSMRASCRPNPVSMSLVKLIGRRGLMLTVAKLDAYTGTPLIDIKSYFQDYDCCKAK